MEFLTYEDLSLYSGLVVWVTIGKSRRLGRSVSIRFGNSRVFVSARKLIHGKVLLSQADLCPVNMRSRPCDLGSPAGQCKIASVRRSRTLRGDF